MYSVVLPSMESVLVLSRLLDTVAVLVPFGCTGHTVCHGEKWAEEVRRSEQTAYFTVLHSFGMCSLMEGMCLKMCSEACFYSSPHLDCIP
jgi:hypothetical protein